MTVLFTLGCSVSAWMNIRTFEGNLLRARVTAADQLSRSLTSATWHAMRAGRKDDAYAVMQVMGEHQGVGYIRLFAKRGRVAFSSQTEGPRHLGIEASECRVCHQESPPRNTITLEERVRTLTGPEGSRTLSILTPILNEPACSTAACHAHDPKDHVLGILEVGLDLADLDRELHEFTGRTVLFMLLKVAVLGAFIAFFIRRFVGRPIRKLQEGTKQVGALHLSEPIHLEEGTELGDLAASFNEMRNRLWKARAKSVRFTEELERQVEERTRELASAQAKLIQSDRLASLGQLSASVAHEVNNPISAVLNLSMFLRRILTDEGIPEGRVGEFQHHLQQIAQETERVGRIVTDLLAFSRRSAPRVAPVDLNEVAERTLGLVQHKMELARITLERGLGHGMPLVPCDRSQVEQVLLNLILNAIEAIGEGGRITVRTGTEAMTETAILQVEDDGSGIAREHLARIFDPFFSTKAAERGAGLGLAVAYGIAEAHGGRLDVTSEVGRGTVFTLRLPLHPGEPSGPGHRAPEETP